MAIAAFTDSIALAGAYTSLRVTPFTCTTPVSAIKALAYLLPLDELLRLWEPQKWILGTIWGL